MFIQVGLQGPFTIRAKIFLQDMWTAGLEWDEEIDESLSNSARTWFTELHDLQRLKIPRCLQEIEQEIEAVTLHTFVDASEEAYGAVVYTSLAIATVLYLPTLWLLKQGMLQVLLQVYQDWN